MDRVSKRLLFVVQAAILIFRGTGCAVVPSPAHARTLPSPRDCAGQARPKAEPPALAVVSPKDQARRLVSWLQGDVSGSALGSSEAFSGQMLSRDVERQYREMSAELGWKLQPWRLVGRELSLQLSGGLKKWARVKDHASGETHRLRVYQIPTPRLKSVTPQSVQPTPPAVQPTPASRSLSEVTKLAA